MGNQQFLLSNCISPNYKTFFIFFLLFKQFLFLKVVYIIHFFRFKSFHAPNHYSLGSFIPFLYFCLLQSLIIFNSQTFRKTTEVPHVINTSMISLSETGLVGKRASLTPRPSTSPICRCTLQLIS